MDKDPGLTGNLLVERLVGAHVELVSKEELAKHGSMVSALVLLVFNIHVSIYFLLYFTGLIAMRGVYF